MDYFNGEEYFCNTLCTNRSCRKFNNSKKRQTDRLTHKCKVALQKFSVGVKPGLGEPAVLVLAYDVVHDVAQ